MNNRISDINKLEPGFYWAHYVDDDRHTWIMVEIMYLPEQYILRTGDDEEIHPSMLSVMIGPLVPPEIANE